MTTNYNHLSDRYDQTKISPLRKYVDQYTLLKVLGNVQHRAVLDLACGQGHYTRLVKARGAAQVVGVDISEAMIAAARLQEQQTPFGLTYHVADVAHLEQIGTFDIVLAVYLFPYAATSQQLLGMCRAIYRNLKPGGRVVAAIFNPALSEAELPGYQKYGANISAPFGLLDGAALRASLEIPGGSIEVSAVYWSQETYEQSLSEAGFQNIAWHPMQVPEEAIRHYGLDYWQTYQTKSLDVVLECFKPVDEIW